MKGSTALVGLDAQSATQTAHSLANAIGQLATDNPASGFDPNNGTTWSGPNPFWTALAEKAQQSADYIATTKRAQRYYYGSSPWSETIVNGDGSVIIVDNIMGASGILDDRRDFEVGTAEARAVLRKGAQAAAGRRDREIADANLTLAQARSSYEVGWAQMGEEDSQWKLERSDLPIQGSSDGSINTITTAGTQFVPGAFRMTPPAADQQANTPKTSTGFGGNELDEYFSNGFLKNGVDDQSSPAQIAGQTGEPIAQDPQDPNQVQESETLPPDDEGDPGYQPPSQLWLRGATSVAALANPVSAAVSILGSLVAFLPGKPAEPGGVGDEELPFPKFDPAVDELPAVSTVDPLEALREKYLAEFRAKYGEEGEVLLDAFGRAGGKVSVHTWLPGGPWLLFGGKSDADGIYLGKDLVIKLNNDLSADEAADHILHWLQESTKVSAVRKYLVGDDQDQLRRYLAALEKMRKGILEVGAQGGQIGLGLNIGLAAGPFGAPGELTQLFLEVTLILPQDIKQAQKNGGNQAAVLTFFMAVVGAVIQVGGSGSADDFINAALDSKVGREIASLNQSMVARLKALARRGVDPASFWRMFTEVGSGKVKTYRDSMVGVANARNLGALGTIAVVEVDGVTYWGHNAHMYGKGLVKGEKGALLGMHADLQAAWKKHFEEEGVFRVGPKDQLEVHGIRDGKKYDYYEYRMDPAKARTALHQSMGHAEVQMLLNMVDGVRKNGGTLPKNLVIFVDRKPCWACVFILHRLKKYFGIENMRIVFLLEPNVPGNTANYIDF